MPDNIDLDLLLNEALRSYSAAEPPLAWERKILTAVQPRKSAWRPWIAVPALAALALATFIFIKEPSPSPKPISIAPDSIARIADQAPLLQSKPVPRRRVRIPKEQVFPKPSPLTAEERSLLFLAAYHPAEMNDLHQALNATLEIKPMQIAALQIDTENKEN